MRDLFVEVNRNDIVVLKPSSHFSVTYRREGRTLVADDVMRKADPSAGGTDPLGSGVEGCVRQGPVARLALLICRRSFKAPSFAPCPGPISEKGLVSKSG
jgi:hypothetical protein